MQLDPIDPKMVEAVARGICAYDLQWYDCSMACLQADKCVGTLKQIEQAILEARAGLTALCDLLNLTPEALNSLAKGEAAVVNKGEVACEAEAERDELFNRLGRVTSELDLPVGATASRIIEAIDERVDDEREACASLDVRVEVPPGAETWTPLEAWEEALIALNEAWRNAVRDRAASPYAPTAKGGAA